MKYHELENSTKIILKVFLAILAVVFLWTVRDIILILLLAFILSSAMEPLVEYLKLKKVPRAVSVLTVYILVFGLLFAVVSLLAPALVEQLKIAKENFPYYIDQLKHILVGIVPESWLSLDDISSFISQNGQARLITGTFGIFSGLFSFLTVLVISFYLLAEERGIKNFVSTLIPEKHQDFILNTLDKIQTKMGLWILGQIILSISIFIITYIGLLILRVPNALLLALLAGFLEIVPYIGPFVSAVPAVLIAFTVSTPLALVVAVMYLLIQKFEGYVLVPKVMQKTVGTSSLVVLVALLIGFKLAGIIGILVAVPLVSALTVVVNEFTDSKT